MSKNFNHTSENIHFLYFVFGRKYYGGKKVAWDNLVTLFREGVRNLWDLTPDDLRWS